MTEIDENDLGWHIGISRDVRVNIEPDDSLTVWLWEETDERGIYSPHPNKGVRLNKQQQLEEAAPPVSNCLY